MCHFIAHLIYSKLRDEDEEKRSVKIGKREVLDVCLFIPTYVRIRYLKT